MRIIGIDPGYGRMGYGLVEKKGSDWTHVAHGCIETSAKVEFSERLLQIHNELKRLITRHNPDRAAVEDLFFAKNVKTAMQVGQARGVILLTLFQAGLTVDEYTPLQVKQAITGYGRAEKGQVQKMLAILLKLPAKKLIQDDAADALAVALAAGVSLRMKRLSD
ncbi:MAG: crossover junction endodeoxyribonuclease RuvC [Patescibacteria group bacterium]